MHDFGFKLWHPSDNHAERDIIKVRIGVVDIVIELLIDSAVPIRIGKLIGLEVVVYLDSCNGVSVLIGDHSEHELITKFLLRCELDGLPALFEQ